MTAFERTSSMADTVVPSAMVAQEPLVPPHFPEAPLAVTAVDRAAASPLVSPKIRVSRPAFLSRVHCSSYL